MSTRSPAVEHLQEALETAQVVALDFDLDSATGNIAPPSLGDKASPLIKIADRDGNSADGVVVNGTAAETNARKLAFLEDRKDSTSPLSRVNRVVLDQSGVEFPEERLSGGIANTAIYVGTAPDGTKMAEFDEYLRAVTTNPNRYKAMLKLSALTAVCGSWMSYVKGGAVSPAIIRTQFHARVLDEIENGRVKTKIDGWRKDGLTKSTGDTKGAKTENSGDGAPSNEVDVTVSKKITTALREEFPGLVDGEAGTKDKLSSIGLGGTPGGTTVGVAVADIRRTSVIPLPLVRAIKVGDDVAENRAVQEAVLALATYLDLIRLRELHVRVGCALWVTSSRVRIDGQVFEVDRVEFTEQVKEWANTAVDAAAGIVGWNGSVFTVKGNPTLNEIVRDELKVK
ncbi:MAG: hypothetical protein E6R04_06155 [Spirochaetes bacterium]|jgi:hypothetical protein|nr:MAG: hypothetical protein E6R04_06155 [Spirochaetota bacterium]